VSAKPRKRRSPGEGSVWAYKTKAGQERYAIGYTVELPDGTRRSVTRRRGGHGEKWTTRGEASKALRAILADVDKGQHVDPSRQQLGAYLDEWLAGLRLAPSTVASYRKNVRLHIKPYLGAVPLASLTTARINALYRELEASGRRDHRGERTGQPLSARTVRYLSTILHKALGAAVKDHRLARNPTDTADPPTAKQAKAPEQEVWSADQLAAFLAWSAEHSQLHALWHVLANTGMRRGEALALRWRDIDLDNATVSVRRSAGVVRNKGEGGAIVEDDTKTGKARVIDLDEATIAVLRAHKRERGSMALPLALDGAVVFGDHEGRLRNGERVWRQFKTAQAACRRALGDAALPEITLHGLRHTHATILLTAREPVHVVSRRIGHASPVVTMQVYAHVLPGSQRESANTFARLLKEARAQS
jgi:integrase